jgi:16S rRNA (cytidine1402-2'-O)-methyltransferase
MLKGMKISIVATPIGNLEDITFRAVRILEDTDLIICEDTRHTKILLDHLKITGKKLVSFHAKSGIGREAKICQEIRDRGWQAALVTDAGTPGISDPGFRMVREALAQNIPLESIPGVSAFQTLLPVSGLRIDRFQFWGFIPHKKNRETFLKSLVEAEDTTLFYESVHRFPKLLKQLRDFLEPDRQICVGRELTKKFEEVFRGSVAEALEFFTEGKMRGEFVVMVSGRG